MKSLAPTSLRALLLFGLVSGLLLGTAALAVEEEMEDFLDARSIGRVQIQAVSTEGKQILTRITAARTAIQKRDLQKARFEAAKARAMLQEVRYKSPAVRLQDKIARALDLAQKGKATTNDLQPIFAELDAVSSVDEMEDVREQVDVAKGHIVKGSQREAADALVVASTRISYLEIDLPIEETLGRLNRAIHQLRHHNPLAASATLGEAASHVEIFITIASSTDITGMSDVGAGPR